MAAVPTDAHLETAVPPVCAQIDESATACGTVSVETDVKAATSDTCVYQVNDTHSVDTCSCSNLVNPEVCINADQSLDSTTQPITKPETNQIDFVVGRSVKTRVLHKINSGSFGAIHLGELLPSGKRVAVKLELQNQPHPQLMSEGNIYRHLADGQGIPKVHWFGLHEPLYNVMVMDLLGPSLQDLFAYCGRRFSVKTTLMLADQMLSILEFIHHQKYIHRDIKPDNFVIGLGDHNNQIFIIDFGLAKKIVPQRSSFGHIGTQVMRPLVGTVRYAGIHAHMGQEEGPREDLESLAYCWLYFLRGSLPWQGVIAKTREEKFARIFELKKTATSVELCEGLPIEFGKFLDRVKLMRKDEMLDYNRIRELFKRLAAKMDIVYDLEFDWVTKQRETGDALSLQIKPGNSHSSS